MKIISRISALASLLVLMFVMNAAAGSWQQNGNGWWWNNGDGTYPSNGWAWCDGNYDGTAECYYFDQNGYCLMNTQTPDGYQVNSSGAWIVNGVVQNRYVGVQETISNDRPAPDQGYQGGVAQDYTLAGYLSLTTSEEGAGFGYLSLNNDGTGVIKLDQDSPEYQLTWTISGDEVLLTYGFDTHRGYYYEDLAQIRIPIADNVYYFQAV